MSKMFEFDVVKPLGVVPLLNKYSEDGWAIFKIDLVKEDGELYYYIIFSKEIQ